MNKKHLILAFVIPVIAGCMQTWTYDNVRYDSSASALKAARTYVQNGVDGVEPLAEPLDLTARVVSPSLLLRYLQ